MLYTIKETILEKTDIVEMLKEFKEKSGWSYEKIAREIGVSTLSVQNWIKGKFKPSRLAEKEISFFLKKHL